MTHAEQLDALLDGAGFVVVREGPGADPDGLSKLGRGFGTLRLTGLPDPDFHTPAGDLLLIGAVCPAAIEVVSTSLLHDVLARRTWASEALHEPWEMEGVGARYFRAPLFTCHGRRRQCYLQLSALRRRYQGSASVHGAALSVLQCALEELPRQTVLLEPGDVLIANNRRVAHRGLCSPRVVLRSELDLHQSPYRIWREGDALGCPSSPYRNLSVAHGLFYGDTSTARVASA